MDNLSEAAQLLTRASELPAIYQGIAKASFNDICDVDELPDYTSGVVDSVHQARRLASNRKRNGLEAAGAIIDKPGMPLKFVLSRFHEWLTSPRTRPV